MADLLRPTSYLIKSIATSKGGRGAASKARLKAVSRSQKAGLQFPVRRLARFLKACRYAQRIDSDAPVFVSAVLEYLAAELAGNAARDIQLAMRNFHQLGKLLAGIIILNGEVLLNFHQVLLHQIHG